MIKAVALVLLLGVAGAVAQRDLVSVITGNPQLKELLNAVTGVRKSDRREQSGPGVGGSPGSSSCQDLPAGAAPLPPQAVACGCCMHVLAACTCACRQAILVQHSF